MDYSTINLDKLRSLPVYKGPHWVHHSMGSGCFMDPPGYPTYFIQAIYNSRGDHPTYGPSQVICEPDGTPRALPEYDYPNGEAFKATLRDLYIPLAADHPRVVAWMAVAYGYFGGMWEDPTIEASKRANVSELTTKPGPVDWYRPVTFIRQWYPEHAPVSNGNTSPSGYGKGGPGSWWETEAERPTPAACRPRSIGAHPVNHTWCQWCGWTAED